MKARTATKKETQIQHRFGAPPKLMAYRPGFFRLPFPAASSFIPARKIKLNKKGKKFARHLLKFMAICNFRRSADPKQGGRMNR